MPTYDYECDACGRSFERFQRITAKPVRTCPKCGKRRARRLIGAGAAVIFKGSGFYQTDYRSAEYKRKSSAEKTSASAPASSSDSKKSDEKSDKMQQKTSD